MCRLPEAAKDSEGASQSATQLLFMFCFHICCYPGLVKVVKPPQPWPDFYSPGQGLSQGCPLARQWDLGAGGIAILQALKDAGC